MKPGLLFVAAVASSVAVLAACGGAKEQELFGSSGSPPDIGTDTSGTEPGATSSSGTTTSGSSGTTSSTSSGGSSSGGSTSSGGSSSGSTTPDAGTSSGGTTTSKGIWCGEDQDNDDIFCNAGTICCAKSGSLGPSLECAANAGSCTGGLAIKCDDQTDCPTGQVCCGTFEENFGYKAVQCSPSCNSVSGTTRSVRFCDEKAATDECAAIGKTCSWSQALPGYAVCK